MMTYRRTFFIGLIFPFLILLLLILIRLRFSEKPGEMDEGRERSEELRSYPSDWAWMQRTFPYWKADPDAHLDAMRAVQKMRAEARLRVEQNLKKGNADLQWQFAGPTNIGGRIVDIEFDPQDPTILYAAAATGGVFKSTDLAANWTPVFDEQAILTIGDIGIDPQNPGTIYVGTGEANGGHNNFAGGGVYKSSDGGATWEFIGLEHTVSIGRVLLHPHNSQRVYVAAVGSYFSPNPERGVYRSDDAGTTWDNVLFVSDSTGAIDLVMHPQNPDTMLAALWERVRRPNDNHLYGETGGIYRSYDGGDHWERLGPERGLPDPEVTRVGRIGLALCQSSPDVIYALYNDGATYTGLYKTVDGGDTWTRTDPDGQIATGSGGFSWYFGQVRVDPTDPDIVYALDVAFMRSSDGGQTWSLNYGNSTLHVDHHALAFFPQDPSILVEGNDGGMNTSFDGGLSWSKVKHLPVTQFYEIGLDATNPERLYGGTQDNGTMRTLSGGLSDWATFYGGDGFYVIVDPTDPNVIYAESQNGALGKSTNGGNSFFFARSGINNSEPTNWSTPVVMDPNDNTVLYYGTDRIYRTGDAANLWTPISPDLTDGLPGTRLGTVTTIAVAPTNSNVIYAGTDDSHVWVSADYGSTWADISADLPYRWVTRVAVDPTDEHTAYVTFSGLKWRDPQPHVFRTTDMGLTWEDISHNLPDAPVNAFAVDPVDPHVLYLGSDVGAFVSFDWGASWEILGTGLPLVTINDLKIHASEHFLVAGTHGRSMYKLDLSEAVTAVPFEQQGEMVSSFELQPNYPNPFNPTTVIPYRIAEKTQVTLKVFNLLGEEVRTLADEVQAAGQHEVQWDGRDQSGLPMTSGVYVYRLRAGDLVESRKMILVK